MKLKKYNETEVINKTIYVIDDDPLVRLIVEKIMSRVTNSLTFVHYENGKISLHKLSE